MARRADLVDRPAARPYTEGCSGALPPRTRRPAVLSVEDRSDDAMMALALTEARLALEKDEVPVGAVAVHEGRVIARAHNLRETLRDPTAHAEMVAITQAAEALETWRLDDVTLYVTLEPCPMCAGAVLQARVSRIVFGAHDPKAGACGSRIDLIRGSGMPFTVEVTSGIRADDCAGILREFFLERRSKGKPEE